MILRDYLAVDRTALANERTLLAYIRTAISIIAAGIGFIKLFEVKIIVMLGYAAFPLGVIFLLIGIFRFIVLENKILKMKH